MVFTAGIKSNIIITSWVNYNSEENSINWEIPCLRMTYDIIPKQTISPSPEANTVFVREDDCILIYWVKWNWLIYVVRDIPKCRRYKINRLRAPPVMKVKTCRAILANLQNSRRYYIVEDTINPLEINTLFKD